MSESYLEIELCEDALFEDLGDQCELLQYAMDDDTVDIQQRIVDIWLSLTDTDRYDDSYIIDFIRETKVLCEIWIEGTLEQVRQWRAS